MQFKVRFAADSNQQALNATQSFKYFLQQNEEELIEEVHQERAILKPDEAGGLLSSALELEVSEEKAIDFVRSLGDWIKQPKANPVSISIELSDGKKLTLTEDQLAGEEGKMLHQILQTLR